MYLYVFFVSSQDFGAFCLTTCKRQINFRRGMDFSTVDPGSRGNARPRQLPSMHGIFVAELKMVKGHGSVIRGLLV